MGKKKFDIFSQELKRLCEKHGVEIGVDCHSIEIFMCDLDGRKFQDFIAEEVNPGFYHLKGGDFER